MCSFFKSLSSSMKDDQIMKGMKHICHALSMLKVDDTVITCAQNGSAQSYWMHFSESQGGMSERTKQYVRSYVICQQLS